MLMMGVFLFLAIVIEIYVIVQVAQAIGGWETFGLLVLQALVGSWIIKIQGIASIRRIGRALDQRSVPGKDLVDGFLLMMAGFLIMIPGFISTGFGVLLLLPPTRAVVRSLPLQPVQARVLRPDLHRHDPGHALRRALPGPAGPGHHRPRRHRPGARGSGQPTRAAGMTDALTPLVPDVADEVEPGVVRVLCDNPGMMTGPGTNTYLIGHDELAVIDPGPDHEAHLDAVARLGGDRIRWILCTHTHLDHSPGAAGLAARTGAAILSFADVDGLVCDEHLADGDSVEVDGIGIEAVHTPGHASNHLCFRLQSSGLLFSGDHVMDGSTVVISPPDGDMAAYLDSLERLLDLGLPAIAPAHGRLIEDPDARVLDYLTHRRSARGRGPRRRALVGRRRDRHRGARGVDLRGRGGGVAPGRSPERVGPPPQAGGRAASSRPTTSTTRTPPGWPAAEPPTPLGHGAR